MTTFLNQPDYRHGTPERIGVLAVNLGTPDDPSTAAVRRYLAEFLWDPRIIEVPRPIWWLVLNLVILRFRPAKSAHAYRTIWTPEGSPLLLHSRALAAGLETTLASRLPGPVKVELAMTYGNPSIAAGLEKLRAAGARRILVLPLYPQYSATTTASIFDRISKELRRWRWLPEPVSITKARRPKSLRLSWSDGDRMIAVSIASAGERKSRVQVEQGKLRSKREVEQAKDAWAERLEALARLLGR